MKIAITGGHVTPAVAVIEEIQKSHKDWDIVFVGRKYAMEGEKEVSAEYRFISNLGIAFLPLTTGRSSSIASFMKVPVGFVQSWWYLFKERPSIIVSFGGYLAPPVVIMGKLCGIPSLTHEQTRTLGWANKTMIPFVEKICISYPEVAGLSMLPKEKTVVTGLPLRRELFSLTKKPLFSVSQKYPLIYIAGGATGSEFISTCVRSILPQLLKRYTIVHQTGYSFYAIAAKAAASLSKEEQFRYHMFPYLKADELSWIYQHAKLYVGRSGANTVGELAALGKVAVCIPYPWLAQKEQEKNGQWLVDAGSAVMLHQEDITQPSQLFEKIEEVVAHYEQYHKKAQEFAKKIPLDGASRLVDEIEKLLP